MSGSKEIADRITNLMVHDNRQGVNPRFVLGLICTIAIMFGSFPLVRIFQNWTGFDDAFAAFLRLIFAIAALLFFLMFSSKPKKS